MSVINFYEKYGISQTEDLEKIQWLINQKIMDEENDPFGEGHSDRMSILQLAREAFATIENKAKYDQDLADSMKKSDPDGERKALLDKWYADAINYFANKQYDLAKTAIDRAMQYITHETADGAIYKMAAGIYTIFKMYPQALDFYNESIVLSPEDATAYYMKSITLYNYLLHMDDNHGDVDRMRDIWQQLEETCKFTISKVSAQGHGYEQASECYEILAEMYYVPAKTEYNSSYDQKRFPITGDDNALAEEYALKAFSIIKASINASSPDICTTAKKILDDIFARRERIAELKKANANILQENESLKNKIYPEYELLKRHLFWRLRLKESVINEILDNFNSLIGIGIGFFVFVLLLFPFKVLFRIDIYPVSMVVVPIIGGIVTFVIWWIVKNICEIYSITMSRIDSNLYERRRNNEKIEQNNKIIALLDTGLAP